MSENIEYERLADISDIGTQNAEEQLALSLSAHRAAMTPTEDPDEDAQGNRYCLDCAEIIPQERVQAVRAVRCVACAGKREQFSKLARSRGGAGRVFSAEAE